MNEFSTTNVITTPEEAVDQFVGEQFIEWAMHSASHEVKNWPQIQQISSETYKPEKIKKFMLQRFMAEEAFLGGRDGDPGFLRFAIANLSESNDPAAETALEILEKKRLDELEGHRIEKGIIQTRRRELWVRLLKALGLTEEELHRAEPKEPTRNYIAELSDIYSNADWQVAVGAFAAHEAVAAEEYKAMAQMLSINTSLAEKDKEILMTYAGATPHLLDKIVFDQENKQLVWEGVRKQLDLSKEFIQGLAKYLENN